MNNNPLLGSNPLNVSNPNKTQELLQNSGSILNPSNPNNVGNILQQQAQNSAGVGGRGIGSGTGGLVAPLADTTANRIRSQQIRGIDLSISNVLGNKSRLRNGYNNGVGASLANAGRNLGDFATSIGNFVRDAFTLTPERQAEFSSRVTKTVNTAGDRLRGAADFLHLDDAVEFVTGKEQPDSATVLDADALTDKNLQVVTGEEGNEQTITLSDEQKQALVEANRKMIDESGGKKTDTELLPDSGTKVYLQSDGTWSTAPEYRLVLNEDGSITLHAPQADLDDMAQLNEAFGGDMANFLEQLSQAYRLNPDFVYTYPDDDGNEISETVPQVIDRLNQGLALYHDQKVGLAYMRQTMSASLGAEFTNQLSDDDLMIIAGYSGGDKDDDRITFPDFIVDDFRYAGIKELDSWDDSTNSVAVSDFRDNYYRIGSQWDDNPVSSVLDLANYGVYTQKESEIYPGQYDTYWTSNKTRQTYKVPYGEVDYIVMRSLQGGDELPAGITFIPNGLQPGEQGNFTQINDETRLADLPNISDNVARYDEYELFADGNKALRRLQDSLEDYLNNENNLSDDPTQYARAMALDSYLSNTNPSSGFGTTLALAPAAIVSGVGTAGAKLIASFVDMVDYATSGVVSDYMDNMADTLSTITSGDLFRGELHNQPFYNSVSENGGAIYQLFDSLGVVDSSLGFNSFTEYADAGQDELISYFEPLSGAATTLYNIAEIGGEILGTIGMGKAAQLITPARIANTAKRAFGAASNIARLAANTRVGKTVSNIAQLAGSAASLELAAIRGTNTAIHLGSLWDTMVGLYNQARNLTAIRGAAQFVDMTKGAAEQVAGAIGRAANWLNSGSYRSGLVRDFLTLPAEILVDSYMDSPAVVRAFLSGTATDEEKTAFWQLVGSNATFYSIFTAAGIAFHLTSRGYGKLSASSPALQTINTRVSQFGFKASTLATSLRNKIRNTIAQGDWISKIKNPKKAEAAISRAALSTGAEMVANAGKGLKGQAKTRAILDAQNEYIKLQNAADNPMKQAQIVYSWMRNSNIYPQTAKAIKALEGKIDELAKLADDAGLISKEMKRNAIKAGVYDTKTFLTLDIDDYVGYKVEIDNLLRKEAIGDKNGYASLSQEEDNRLSRYQIRLDEIGERLPDNIKEFINSQLIPSLQNAYRNLNDVFRRDFHVRDESQLYGWSINGYTGANNEHYIRTQRTKDIGANGELLARRQWEQYNDNARVTRREGALQEEQHYRTNDEIEQDDHFLNPLITLNSYIAQMSDAVVMKSRGKAYIAASSDPRTLVSGNDLAQVNNIKRGERQYQSAMKDAVKVANESIDTLGVGDTVSALFFAKRAKSAEDLVATPANQRLTVKGMTTDELLQILPDDFEPFTSRVFDQKTWAEFYEDASPQVKSAIRTDVNLHSKATGFGDYIDFGYEYAPTAKGKYGIHYQQDSNLPIDFEKAGTADNALSMMYDRQRVTGKDLSSTELEQAKAKYPELQAELNNAETRLASYYDDKPTIGEIVNEAYASRDTAHGFMDGADANGDYLPTWEAWQATLKQYPDYADEIERLDIISRPELWQGSEAVVERTRQVMRNAKVRDKAAINQDSFAKSRSTLEKAIRSDNVDEALDTIAMRRRIAQLEENLSDQMDTLLDDIVDDMKVHPAFNGRVHQLAVYCAGEGASDEVIKMLEDYITYSTISNGFSDLGRAVGQGVGKARPKAIMDQLKEKFKSVVENDSEIRKLPLTARDRDKISDTITEVFENNLDVKIGELKLAIEDSGAMIPMKEDLYAKLRKLNRDIANAYKKVYPDNPEVQSSAIMYMNDEGLPEFVEVNPNFAWLYNYQVSGRYAGRFERIFTSNLMQRLNRMSRFTQVVVNPSSMVNQAVRDTLSVIITTGMDNFSVKVSNKFIETLEDEVKRLEPAAYAQLQEIANETGEEMSDLLMRRETALGMAESSPATEQEFFRINHAATPHSSVFTAKMSDMGKRMDEIIDKFGTPNAHFERNMRTRAYNNGMAEALANGKSLADARAHATFFARNSATNYNRQLYHLASLSKATNYVASMFNGFRSFWRMFALDPVGISSRIVGGLVIPTIAATTYALSDPQIREQWKNLDERDKEDKFVFALGGTIHTIPIPEELNVFVSSIRKTIESLYDTNRSEFWKLAFDEILQFGPVDMSAVVDIDNMVMTGEMTAGDRAISLLDSLMSQLAPTPVRTAYELATNRDAYFGSAIADSQAYFDTDTLEWVYPDGNAGLVANALGLYTSTDPSVVSKIITNMMGSWGKELIDTVAGVAGGVLTGNFDQVAGTLGKLPESAFDRATGVLTPDLYDETLAAWNAGISELWSLREAADGRGQTLEDKVNELNEALRNETDSDKKQEIIAERDNLTKPFYDRVKYFVDRYQNVYGGTIDTYRFNSLVRCVLWGSVTADNAGSVSQSLAQDLNYDNWETARRRLMDLGVTDNLTQVDSLALENGDYGHAFPSMISHVTTGDDGKAVTEYYTPIDILNAQAIVYGSDDVQTQHVKNLLEGRNIWELKDQVQGKIDEIYSRGDLTSTDYDEVDDYRIAWNAAVMELLAPYFSEQTIESIVNNSSMIDYLDGVFLVPSDFKVSNRGRYMPSSSRLNSSRGYAKSLIEAVYNEVVNGDK